MSIENETNKRQFMGNGSTSIFPLNFRVDSPDWIKIFFGKDGNQVQITSGFYVDGAGTEAVSVVFTTPPINGVYITILRELPLVQTLELENTGPFHAADVEKALDKIVMMLQQLAEILSRSVTGPESSDPGDISWKDLFEAKNTAVASMNMAIAAKDAAVIAKDLAVVAKDLAQKWASNPEDVQVLSGLYSAFHWAMKAQEAVNIPDASTTLKGKVMLATNEDKDNASKVPSAALVQEWIEGARSNVSRILRSSVTLTGGVDIPFDSIISIKLFSGGGGGGKGGSASLGGFGGGKGGDTKITLPAGAMVSRDNGDIETLATSEVFVARGGSGGGGGGASGGGGGGEAGPSLTLHFSLPLGSSVNIEIGGGGLGGAGNMPSGLAGGDGNGAYGGVGGINSQGGTGAPGASNGCSNSYSSGRGMGGSGASNSNGFGNGGGGGGAGGSATPYGLGGMAGPGANSGKAGISSSAGGDGGDGGDGAVKINFFKEVA